jgi:hypothetical protein
MISPQKVLIAGFLVVAGSVYTPAQSQSDTGKAVGQKSGGKHYVLPANKNTVQWGWLDLAEKPKVVVDSGDTVSIETLSHAMDEIKPGASMHEIVGLLLGVRSRGVV